MRRRPKIGTTGLATIDRDAAIFPISVAAELAGMHPQTLRTYDRIGLVVPSRARGRGRRYSPADVAALRMIQHLSQEEGVNLNGIQRILELQRRIAQLDDLAALRQLVPDGVTGAIIGTALYVGNFTLTDALAVASGRPD